ncbi:hydroxyisourate hydrolase [Nitriliruptoraceae bacterium ZYF776]|nr:hydroxyisourate hydrolase [Profundirhabdus halotolerans]
MSLSTHVLDTSIGRPVRGMPVFVDRRDGERDWQHLRAAETDPDGRIPKLLPAGSLSAGVYRLTFATGDWAESVGTTSFYPEVTIVVEITSPEEHHHVPLLLSPYGYTTYRGS